MAVRRIDTHTQLHRATDEQTEPFNLNTIDKNNSASILTFNVSAIVQNTVSDRQVPKGVMQCQSFTSSDAICPRLPARRALYAHDPRDPSKPTEPSATLQHHARYALQCLVFHTTCERIGLPAIRYFWRAGVKLTVRRASRGFWRSDIPIRSAHYSCLHPHGVWLLTAN